MRNKLPAGAAHPRRYWLGGVLRYQELGCRFHWATDMDVVPEPEVIGGFQYWAAGIYAKLSAKVQRTAEIERIWLFQDRLANAYRKAPSVSKGAVHLRELHGRLYVNAYACGLYDRCGQQDLDRSSTWSKMVSVPVSRYITAGVSGSSW